MVHRTRRPGFTLIELLVVIAIITILAAILFPVFAQAREKARQTSCLSNAKQLSLGINMYVQDFDETMPFACGYYAPAGGWMWPYVGDSPADARSSNTQWVNGMGGYWFNLIQPYTKNGQIARCPTASALSTLAGPFQKTPYDMSMTFNGLLWGYPLAGVLNPTDVPTVWEGTGTTWFRGYVAVQPVLVCQDATQPCVYQPTSASCSANVNGQVSTGFTVTPTAWVHNKGQVWTYVDGHAKWRRLGEGKGNSYKRSPWSTYSATGAPTGSWNDGCHRLLFKPDLDLSQY